MNDEQEGSGPRSQSKGSEAARQSKGGQKEGSGSKSQRNLGSNVVKEDGSQPGDTGPEKSRARESGQPEKKKKDILVCAFHRSSCSGKNVDKMEEFRCVFPKVKNVKICPRSVYWFNSDQDRIACSGNTIFHRKVDEDQAKGLNADGTPKFPECYEGVIILKKAEQIFAILWKKIAFLFRKIS